MMLQDGTVSINYLLYSDNTGGKVRNYEEEFLNTYLAL